jgi:capsid protein
MPVMLKSRIVDERGRPFARPARRLHAKYDSAQTVTDNIRHWAWADSMSADAANSSTVRKTLRERSRYEVANNGWARAMVETLAHEVIGTGPRMQILTGNPDADAWIEVNWWKWAYRKVHLGRKLRTMRKAKAQDGEAIGLYVTNPRLGDVQLDLREIETEQCATPTVTLDDNQVDGIDLDELGNPLRYRILKHHPGADSYAWTDAEIDPPPRAEEVMHVFRRDRPGQHRGIPELTPALPLFSKLRRYNLAVLQAAENVADLSLLLKTKHPETTAYNWGTSGDTDNEPSEYKSLDAFDVERGMVMVLPEETEPFQIEPKQPVTTHVEYVKSVLAEGFACVCMPYSVGAADSSDENFASGKLTRLGFKRAVQVERRLDWDPEVERLFWAWFAEAKFALPVQFRGQMLPLDQWQVLIYWDGVEDIDPEKAARARKAELESGQTSYPSMYAEKGQDWETEQNNQAKALGLTIKEYRRRLADKLLGPSPKDTYKAEEIDDEQPPVVLPR